MKNRQSKIEHVSDLIHEFEARQRLMNFCADSDLPDNLIETIIDSCVAIRADIEDEINRGQLYRQLFFDMKANAYRWIQ